MQAGGGRRFAVHAARAAKVPAPRAGDRQFRSRRALPSLGTRAFLGDTLPRGNLSNAEARRHPLRDEQHLPRGPDRRPRSPEGSRSYLDGTSAGKWDGDTLVIDTIGFNGKTWLDTTEHPSSDALHVIERIHLLDADHLAYEMTAEDPKMYTMPIKNSRVFVRMKPGQELMEYSCEENNKELLEGHEK
jgi:hypothetical protein